MKKVLIIFCLLFSISRAVDVTNLSVISLNRDTLKLHQIIDNDQPTFIYLWATWCHVCRKDMPKMIRFFEQQSGVRFIPIAYRESSTIVKKFLHENGHQLNTFIDYSGEVFNEFGVESTPTVVIFDRNKHVVFNGYKSIRYYGKILKKLISE